MAVRVLLITLTCLNLLKFIATKDMTGFIVGGEFSTIEEFPHVAFLHIRCKVASTSYCGSSILNQVLLLTAAHCVIDCKDKNIYTIKAYTGNVKKYKGDENRVVGFKIHEQYDTKNFTNDIALLVLKDELKFKSGVKKILLLKNLPQYTSAKIAGWGWIDDQNTKTDVLKHTSQTVISYNECYQKLLGIPVGTVCGFNPNGSHPQRGDSGSALVINDNIQLGIASYFRRRVSNTTLVYTYVPFFYDWILNSASELYCEYRKKKIWLDEEAGNSTQSTTASRTVHDFMH